MREIARILCGSRLYGTNVRDSDHDFKVVFIPGAQDILLGQVKNVCKKEGGDDAEYMSYQQYLKLLCQGQTIALDMAFAPRKFHQQEPGPEWYSIDANLGRFLSRNCKAFVGYCRQQASKYVVKKDRLEAVQRIVDVLKLGDGHGVKKVRDLGGLSSVVNRTPFVCWKDGLEPRKATNVRHLSVCETLIPDTASVKEALRTYEKKLAGYGARVRAGQNAGDADWKSMYHAVRVGYQAIELMETGSITFPRPERNFLKLIRRGRIPLEEVQITIEANLDRVQRAADASELPEQPDWNFADELVVGTYRSATR
jgi:hypothetical protein